MLTVPLMCPETRHLDRMPVFAYWGDRFTEGTPFRPDVVVPIDAVIDVKIDMMCAHVSQFFEWVPYNGGTLDRVPPESDTAGRRAMMARWAEGAGAHWREKAGETFETWFGPRESRYVEPFQICEYGRRPEREELRDLFPLA
jgi:hypothetical protein